MQYKAGKDCTRDFYRIHLNNNPEDINSRVEYVKLLDEMELYKEAFKECKIIQRLSPNNLKPLPYTISYKIKFEGLNSASEYAQNCFISNRDSICAAIYYLHFLIRGYKKSRSDQSIQLILNRLRKKYAWHPDFALAKALLYMIKDKDKAKRVKTLRRRCSDYPGCSISKHYLKVFGKENINDLPELNPSIRQHLKIVKAIHNSHCTSKSEVLYASK